MTSIVVKVAQSWDFEFEGTGHFLGVIDLVQCFSPVDEGLTWASVRMASMS